MLDVPGAVDMAKLPLELCHTSLSIRPNTAKLGIRLLKFQHVSTRFPSVKHNYNQITSIETATS